MKALIAKEIILKNKESRKNYLKQQQMAALDRLELGTLKKGIWLYFFLLIFEGALRKWILPGLATPLLIVRDPVAIWLIYKAVSGGYIHRSIYLTGMILVGIVGVITAVSLGHGNLYVALYGARILLLHFPLIFIIGRIFTREDVVKIGNVTLFISIPMLVLVVFQFYSPQSAWVNRGVGGDLAGGGFSGALGYFRPPATFSFISGTVLFFNLVACFVLFFWLQETQVNKLLLFGATIAVMAAIPLSISRSLFFDIAVALIFAAIAISRKPKFLGRLFGTVLGVAIILIVLSKTSFFQTGTEAFTERFETANEVEGGVSGVLLDRYLGGMIGALKNSDELHFWGLGLGMGTNAGAQLLVGNTSFLISEEEWGRLIGEMGALMGILVIIIRLGVSIQLAIGSYKKVKTGDILAWMLLSFVVLNVPQGQWAQPTTLGFGVLGGGLVLAALKNTEVYKNGVIKTRSCGTKNASNTNR